MRMYEKDQSSSAYDGIKQMILRGDVNMGERIIEVRLAASLGLSRTPIREALRRLTSDGLVVFMPNRGYEVVSYSADDVSEIYSCRALLESEAVRLVAIRGLSDERRKKLAQIVDQSSQVLSEEKTSEEARQTFLSLNNEFHELLYAGCGNAQLLRMIRMVTEIPVSIRNYFSFDDKEIKSSHAGHEQIFKAVQSRQADRAAALMREHIWSVKDQMLDVPPHVSDRLMGGSEVG